MKAVNEGARGSRAGWGLAWAAWIGAGLCATACESGSAPKRDAEASLGSGRQALVLPDGGIVPDGGVVPDGGAALDAGAATDGGSDAAPPDESNNCCSTTSSSGGCNDPVVLACVCDVDPLCCSTGYDSSCASTAVSRCGQECEGRPPVSDCCEEQGVPGCLDPEVQECVCLIDPFCCIFLYDQSCANIAVSSCGISCGAP